MRVLTMALIIPIALAISYLFFVGFMWVIQWLVNSIFATSFDFNVWLLGLLAMVVSVFFKSSK